MLHLVNYSNSVNIASDGSARNGIQQGMEQAVLVYLFCLCLYRFKVNRKFNYYKK